MIASLAHPKLPDRAQSSLLTWIVLEKLIHLMVSNIGCDLNNLGHAAKGSRVSSRVSHGKVRHLEQGTTAPTPGFSMKTDKL